MMSLPTCLARTVLPETTPKNWTMTRPGISSVLLSSMVPALLELASLNWFPCYQAYGLSIGPFLPASGPFDYSPSTVPDQADESPDSKPSSKISGVPMKTSTQALERLRAV